MRAVRPSITFWLQHIIRLSFRNWDSLFCFACCKERSLLAYLCIHHVHEYLCIMLTGVLPSAYVNQISACQIMCIQVIYVKSCYDYKPGLLLYTPNLILKLNEIAAMPSIYNLKHFRGFFSQRKVHCT